MANDPDRWSILDCDVPFKEALRWMFTVGAANAVFGIVAILFAWLFVYIMSAGSVNLFDVLA